MSHLIAVDIRLSDKSSGSSSNINICDNENENRRDGEEDKEQRGKKADSSNVSMWIWYLYMCSEKIQHLDYLVGFRLLFLFFLSFEQNTNDRCAQFIRFHAEKLVWVCFCKKDLFDRWPSVDAGDAICYFVISISSRNNTWPANINIKYESN